MKKTTARIITIEKINEIRFYQMPKAFFHNPLYIGMKNESKIAYAILRDLLPLSIENNWVNDKNEVYVKFSREKMMKRLNIKGSAKYAEIIKELIEKELIVKKRVGLKQVDETYVCLPEELSVIYSDKELLELENTDVDLKFENQTSRSLKIEPQEVLKSNVKKFENQTHINTNTIKTNFNDTNYNISSSSKGKAPNSIHPLIQLFNSSICELKNTTLIKFQNYIQKYNEDFIEAVINYCEERNGKSFTYFEKTIQGFIEQKATTPKLMEEAIDKFNSENKTKKNNALKAKDEKKQEEAFEQSINDRIMEDLAKGFEPETAIAITGEDINNQVKNIIKPKLSETLFNTWIKSLDFRFNIDTVIIGCPNSFTKEIIDKRYINIIMEAISLLSLNEKFKTIVMS